MVHDECVFCLNARTDSIWRKSYPNNNLSTLCLQDECGIFHTQRPSLLYYRGLNPRCRSYQREFQKSVYEMLHYFLKMTNSPLHANEMISYLSDVFQKIETSSLTCYVLKVSSLAIWNTFFLHFFLTSRTWYLLRVI